MAGSFSPMAHLDRPGSLFSCLLDQSSQCQLYSLTPPPLPAPPPFFLKVLGQLPTQWSTAEWSHSQPEFPFLPTPHASPFLFSLSEPLVALHHLSYGQTQHRCIKANTSKPDPAFPPCRPASSQIGWWHLIHPLEEQLGTDTVHCPCSCLTKGKHPALLIGPSGLTAEDDLTSNTLPFCCTHLSVLTPPHHKICFPKVTLIMFFLCFTLCKDHRWPQNEVNCWLQ